MLNKIFLQGRLTRDPELRYTQSQTPVASFALAVERDYSRAGERREADFVDVVAWKGTAEFAQKYFHKGDMAIIAGRLQSRDWTDRDNNKRRSWEVNVESIYFGGAKKSDAEDEYVKSEREGKREDVQPAGSPVNVSASDYADTDGELPF